MTAIAEPTIFNVYDTDAWKVDLPEGEHGAARVARFTITEDEARMDRLRAAIHGHGRGVKAGTYTKLLVNGTLWMSDTPAEVRDHQEPVRQAHARGGRILINGLGIGMVLRAVLASPKVEHVDVVELNPDVAALVGDHYAAIDPRVHVYLDDAHTIKWPADARWTVAWHDIWATITTDDSESRTRLNRKYARRTDWQGRWAQREVAQIKRSGYYR